MLDTLSDYHPHRGDELALASAQSIRIFAHLVDDRDATYNNKGLVFTLRKD